MVGEKEEAEEEEEEEEEKEEWDVLRRQFSRW